MSINTLLPSDILSVTEETILSEIFANPTVSKYLKLLAKEAAKELLELSAIRKPAEEIAYAHENVRGQLAVLSTLLSLADKLQAAQTSILEKE